jgi:hypothetical protein
MNREQTTAQKMVKILTKSCPAFSYEKPLTIATWHGTHCKVSGLACECVWKLKSSCNGGKWKQLGFVDAHNAKEQAKRNKILDDVVAARNK